MSSFSSSERRAARLLAKFPVAKKVAKFVYSRLVFIRAKKTYSFQCEYKPHPVTANQKSSFFGYYDKSPVNGKGLVLSHLTSEATQDPPSAEKSIDLAVFNPQHQLLFRLPVGAYNWQQGCRAQWLNDDFFIYNDFDPVSKKYLSRVFSVISGSEFKTFEYPVQDAYGLDYFLSLNYQRLMTLRPDYGYRNLPVMSEQQLAELAGDGIWKVDFKTSESQLLVSIRQVCEVRPRNEFDGAFHKLNHVMISPDGKQFIFMHRYLIGQQRFDRLMLADVDTGAIRLLSEYGMVSHCFWANSDTILGYMRGPGAKDGYWLIDTNTGAFQALAHDKLDSYGDGHPHVYGDWFVTDTYPDKARMQHLLLCNWKTGKLRELGEFFHGFDFSGESRCDLHPRFSADGKAIFFDSVFSGKRQLYKMELPV